MSATFHALSNHSPDVNSLWLRLDITGIVVLTIATFVPGVYYTFYCEPVLQKIYWAMIITLASGAAVVVLLPRFRSRQWREFRAGIFVTMGLSALIPIIHGIKLFGLKQTHNQSGMYWFCLEGLFYGLGATFYAKRVPERWWPGAFDIWGSSHQVFHVFVLLGLASHLKGLIVGFDYTHSHMRC
jgi:adiponectin receptor